MRELLGRQFAGRIDRGARLGDDDFDRLFAARDMGQKVCHQLFCLAAGGAIADGNQLDPMRADQLRQGHLCAPQIVLGLERIDRVRGKNLAGGIHNRHLHPGADARIKPHGRLAARRRGQKQILEIAGKDVDCLGLCPLTHLARQIQRQ